MANRTIIGCVNRETGAIIFAEESCDGNDYSGCIVRDGEHAGQVAITLNEFHCDDTYYGCVNRSTGRFEIEIPSNCCASVTECTWCKEGRTPSFIEVFVSGFTECNDCYVAVFGSFRAAVSLAYNFNGSYILNQVEGSPCLYRGDSPRPVGVQEKYKESNECEGPSSSDVYVTAEAEAIISSSSLQIRGPNCYTTYDYEIDDDCFSPTGDVTRGEPMELGCGGASQSIISGTPQIDLIGIL